MSRFARRRYVHGAIMPDVAGRGLGVRPARRGYHRPRGRAWRAMAAAEDRGAYRKDDEMADQTIQSQDIKVADVFQAFYVVPDYQREYVWDSCS